MADWGFGTIKRLNRQIDTGNYVHPSSVHPAVPSESKWTSNTLPPAFGSTLYGNTPRTSESRDHETTASLPHSYAQPQLHQGGLKVAPSVVKL